MNAEALDPATLTCPACGRMQLKAHCDSAAASCHWLKCRNRACDAILDPARGRGHRVSGQPGASPGARESFTFTALDGSGHLGPP